MHNDYIEIKYHINKPAQRFRCTLLLREPGHAVLRYVSDEPGRIADMHIASGSTTIAHYRSDLPYVAWRMFDKKGCLIGTLFHICRSVCIFDDHLSYEDLLLDIWISPDGTLRVLDEDEVRLCSERGMLSDTECRFIDDARQHITDKHADIIAGLAGFECTNQALVCTPPARINRARHCQAAADV